MTKKSLSLLLLAGGVVSFAPVAQADTLELSGYLYGNQTWYATNTYILTNRTYVMSNAVLTIEPGTAVRGRDGTPPNYGSLFITRGGKLMAEGTADQPIIFTDEFDDLNNPLDRPVGAASRGKWGGIVVLGKARLNSAASLTEGTPIEDLYEGLPDTAVGGEYIHRFGGSDDNDNSGVMRYVSVRHGSKLLGEVNKEINGWSFCGAGRGTTVENIEAYLNADDGVEMFGGSVNLKNVISAFNEDEAFDTDQGYNGKVQFLFVIQDTSGRDDGSECNGQPQAPYVITDGNREPKSNFEVYNATYIGSGSGGADNDTLNLRKYNFSKWYNCVFTEFQGVRVNIDGTSQPELRYNLWWDHTGAGTGYGGTYCPAVDNPVANPLLRSIDRGNNYALDARPLPGSPAYLGATNAPNDGFYTAAPYKGAFDCEDWMRGWSAMARNGHLGTFVNVGGSTVELAGYLYGNQTWYATNTYILTNRTYVMSNAVLTIEPSTVVRGRDGTPPNYGSLFITRGGKLIADGTPCNPIIFTDEQDNLNNPFDRPVGAASRGKWGGIVVLGKARLNSAASLTEGTPIEDLYEGLPDTAVGGEYIHRFGGSDDNDNSGVMRYVSVRHGSKLLGEVNKEINGWSFCGAGRGTTVENIEAYLNADDGVEMFGGSVNLKNVISAFNEDEAFDTDQGYNGKVQFLFVIQDTSGRDDGSECNGQPQAPYVITDGNREPKSNFEVYNATYIGSGSGGADNDTLNLRRYNFSKWYNCVFTEFQGVRVNIDGTSQPELRYNLWWDHTGAGTGYGGTYCPAVDNPVANPLLRSIDRGLNNLLDPRPQFTSPAYTTYTNTPLNGYYAPVNYAGAFNTNVWMLSWSAIDLNAHLAINIPNGATEALAPACAEATLSIVPSGSDVSISWSSTTGCSYQLQTNATLNGTWGDYASPVTGDGTTKSVSIPVSGTELYIRALAQ